MSHSTANEELWREFIQLYWSLPKLWKVKSDVYKKPQFLTNICPNTSFPLPVYDLFLRRISKNNCPTGNFGHVFVMTFVKRLKFAQTYRIVYGHSLLLYNCCTTCCYANLFDCVWIPLLHLLTATTPIIHVCLFEVLSFIFVLFPQCI
jgi:hypothetical protein